jgi:pyridoxamine 5'-phosphate oxidase
LTEQMLAATWLEQFRRWFAEAVSSPLIVEPNAMVVASAAQTGEPSARTVLLKAVDERGFVFFTNYQSRKATELAQNPATTLVFPWHPVGRQVIVSGATQRVSRAETEAYFASRPRGSQLGAWASPQSRVVTRSELDAAYAGYEERFAGHAVAPPQHWGGLVVRPLTVEFWQGRASRLHDRLRYRNIEDSDWIVERLAP